MRHADAGYEIAINCAKEQGLHLPMHAKKYMEELAVLFAIVKSTVSAEYSAKN